ncbi:MAG: nitroreductase family protein [Spirochaetia bacterium]
MLYKLLQKRRSVRAYEPQAVERAKLERILQAALLSPSSKGSQPWSFILVDDPTLLKTLSNSKPHGAAFLANAAFAIVVCADLEVATAWIEDCSIAAINSQIAMEEEGLGSCWIQIRGRKTQDDKPSTEYVKKTLNLPDHFEVEAIIAAGYPAEPQVAHSLEDLKWERVHHNRFGQQLTLHGE